MKINSLVEVLSHGDPQALAELRTRYPALKSWLVDGLTMGKDDAAPDADIEKQLGAVASAALTATSARAEALAQRLFRRLELVRRLGLAANILAALTSAGIVATIASSSRAALVIALVTFAATVVTGWSQYLDSFGASKGGLGEGANKLADIAVRAERCLRELDIRLITRDGQRGLPTIIQDANQLAADLRLIDISLGGP